MPDREEILRRLTLGDEAFLDALMVARMLDPEATLDPAGLSLVRFGALVATDGSECTWRQTVADAIDAGVSPDQIVDALVALVPFVGFARIVAIAPKVGLAIGYDVDTGLAAR